jgi:hypothetical protein
MSGTGIMLLSDDRPQARCALPTLCTNNQVFALLEELRYTFGEGPCVDAHATRDGCSRARPGGSRRARWPAFSPVEVGVGAVFGFPVRIGIARRAQPLPRSTRAPVRRGASAVRTQGLQ